MRSSASVCSSTVRASRSATCSARRIAVGASALQQLRRHAHRLQRVLDLVCDLARHLRPRLIAFGVGQALATDRELACHLIERRRELTELGPLRARAR